jgi:hypothetical protein
VKGKVIALSPNPHRSKLLFFFEQGSEAGSGARQVDNEKYRSEHVEVKIQVDIQAGYPVRDA